MQPRWYQTKAVDAWEAEAGKKPDEHQLLVLPTGAGKTVVMADVINRALSWGLSVLVLARSRELVDQNRNTFEMWYPEHAEKTGSYCAGLGWRDTDKQVIFASVQSVFNKGHEMGERRLVIIDEAHQIPANESSQYQTLIKALQENSDRVKILGLTASPYRLDGGVIFGEGQQFDSVAYNVPLSVLINEGYITKPQTLDVTKIDLDNIKKTAGDFNKAEVEVRFLRQPLAKEILDAANAKDARSVLIFASGVAHAETLCAQLRELGEFPHCITGDTLPILRNASIDGFVARRIRFLVNVECLTTGFDAPCVDMLVVARATYSPGLFLQMVGRGFRKYPGKDTCWILDYGQNIERHGPIDSDTYGIDTIKPPSDGTGEAPKRVCPACFEINLAAAKMCSRCDLEFPRKPQDFVASREAILGQETWLDVIHTSYTRHKSKDKYKPDTLRVTYKCHCENSPMNKRYVSEWICIEHTGFGRRKAEEWISCVTDQEKPRMIDDMLDLIQQVGIAQTKRVLVKKDGKYDRVLAREHGEKPEIVYSYDKRSPFF